jgi:type I restriction enzyme S subunit
MLNIGQSTILEMPVPCPPITEQSAIRGEIVRLVAGIVALIDEATNLVKRLEERRSALISAAVTGKIDVRGWQPPADESAFDEEVRQAGLEATA